MPRGMALQQSLTRCGTLELLQPPSQRTPARDGLAPRIAGAGNPVGSLNGSLDKLA